MHLNIRNFPDDVKASLDRMAFESKLSLKDFVIRLLSASVGKKAAPVIKQRKDPRQKKQVVVIKKKTSAEKICKQHKKPMRDFGTKWLCDGPPQHSEVK